MESPDVAQDVAFFILRVPAPNRRLRPESRLKTTTLALYKECGSSTVEPKLLTQGFKLVNRRKILFRTIDLILETDIREDPTLMLESNAVLARRKRTYDPVIAGLTPELQKTCELQFAEINQAFPLHSYDEAPGGGPSLPHDNSRGSSGKVYAETFDVDPEQSASSFITVVYRLIS